MRRLRARALRRWACRRRAAGLRADRVPRRRARGRGRRRVVPAPRHAAPDLPLLRALHVGDRPQRLLRAVRGIDLVELDEARECCGFGGTFAVKNADTSMAMLGDKLRRVLDTRAEVCTAVDNSCLMHIGGALRAPARRRAHDAPRRDPGGPGMSARLPSRRRATALARRPAAPQPRQGDDDDPRQARRGGRGAAPTGRRCATPARRSRRARWRRCPSSSSGSRSAVTRGGRDRPLGARRRRGQRDRRRHRARPRRATR